MIAEAGPLVAGHAGSVPQPGVAGSAHLWQLFVRPPWWGSGVAAALLGEAVAAAAAEGYRRMRLFTPARPGAGPRVLRARGLRAHRLGGARGVDRPGLVEYARELP